MPFKCMCKKFLIEKHLNFDKGKIITKSTKKHESSKDTKEKVKKQFLESHHISSLNTFIYNYINIYTI